MFQLLAPITCRCPTYKSGDSMLNIRNIALLEPIAGRASCPTHLEGSSKIPGWMFPTLASSRMPSPPYPLKWRSKSSEDRGNPGDKKTVCSFTMKPACRHQMGLVGKRPDRAGVSACHTEATPSFLSTRSHSQATAAIYTFAS